MVPINADSFRIKTNDNMEMSFQYRWLYSALVLWHLGEIGLDDALITSSTESRKSIGRDVGSPLPWERNLGVAKQNTIHHHTDTLQPTNETVLN
jgi:hypothetical protein